MLTVDGIRSGRSNPVVLRPMINEAVAVMRQPGGFSVDGIRLPQPTMAMAAPAPAAFADTITAPVAPRDYTNWVTTALAVPLTLAIGWTVTHRHFVLPRLPLAQIQAARTVATAPAVAAQAAKPQAPSAASQAAAVQAQSQALQSLLSGFAAKYPATFGLYVKDMKTGATASVNPDQQIDTASIYKLFVAQTIYKMIDAGQLNLSSPADDAYGQNVGQCLNNMITWSDNNCGHGLGDIIGWGAQDQTLQNFGYNQTNLDGVYPQTSARNVGLLFDKLYSGQLLSADSSGQFLSLLKQQQVNDRLPTGLPAGTTIAHKTGNIDGYVHDAGIVYGPKTDYIVVALSGPWDAPGNAPAAFTDLSQQLWQAFEK